MKNTSKRLGGAILACTLALTQLSATALATDSVAVSARSTLSDVSSSWAATSIERWLDVGLVQGDEQGRFNPSNNLTRGELATIFTNMFGLTQRAANNYADLNGNEWYADAILKCTAAGIMNGDGVNCNATMAVTRQEAMTMFARALGIENGNISTLGQFKDGSSTASWAASALSAMVDMNIIAGVGNGLLAPTANIDRASTMKLLDNAIASYANSSESIHVSNGNKFVIVNSSTGTSGPVEISGYTAGVVVTSGARNGITLNSLIADTVKVDSGVSITISGDSAIKQLDINDGSSVSISKNSTVTTANLNSSANVENSGEIKNLVVNVKSTINNNGTISYARINVSDVIIDGTAPVEISLGNNATAPTNSKGQTVTEIGSSGSGGGSSSSNVSRVTVNSIGELKTALQSSADVLRITLAGNSENYTSSASETMTFRGSELTIDFGSIKPSNGNIAIDAPNATSITFDDSGLNSNGSVFQYLWINAPKADVKNNVQFENINIQAVSNSTFHALDAASSIRIGCGTLEIGQNAKNAVININDTTGVTTVKGNVNTLTVGDGVGHEVNVEANVGSMEIQEQANVVIAPNGAVDNATVASSASGSTISGEGSITTLTTSASVVIEGSLDVGTVNVPISTGAITITVNGSASIDRIASNGANVDIVDNSTGNVPSGTVSVDNIYAITDDVKTQYVYGDMLDLSNVKLNVKYNDGTTNTISVADNPSVTVSVAKKNTASDVRQDILLDSIGDYTVTLSYMGKTATYDITVTEKPITSASITGLGKIAPVVGGEAYTIAEDIDVTPVCCEVGSIAWSDGSQSAVQIFEAGKTYTATISLTADENYKFDNAFAPTVDVNGTVKEGQVLQGGKTMTFTITFPQTVIDDAAITSDNVYSLITALQSKYSEGMSWTNDNFYQSDSLNSAGYGCEAFALICSDAAFGSLPVSKTHSDFDDILVGDMIRMNNDTHTVVVLEKKVDSVVVAEGNYNSSIHWGREISRQSLEDGGFTVRTRYPGV